MTYRKAVFISFILVIVQITYSMIIGDPVYATTGRLEGNDCYMWLYRAELLYETGEWFNHHIARSNFPYGETLHWSRPFDVFLIIGSCFVFWADSFREAVYSWGIWTGPFFEVASISALCWGAVPYISAWGIVLLSALFVSQLNIYTSFFIGQPDHHTFQLFLLVLTFSLFARLFAEKEKTVKYSMVMGGAVGLSLWISTAALLTLLMAVMSFSAVWWLRKTYLKEFAVFSLSVTVFTVFAIVMERLPSAWFNAEYDKISIVHALVCLLIFAVVVFLRFADRKKLAKARIERLVLLLIGGCSSAFIIHYAYPDFFSGPYAKVDPKIIPIWLNFVMETRPYDFVGRGYLSIMLSYFLLFPVIFSLGCSLYLAIKGEGVRKNIGLVSFIGISLYIAPVFYQRRFIHFCNVLTVFPWTLVLLEIWDKRPVWKKGSLKISFAVPALVLSLLINPEVYRILWVTPDVIKSALDDSKSFRKEAKKEKLTASQKKIRNCDIKEISDFMKQRYGNTKGKTILSYVFKGSELLWYSDMNVIGTPYHRNNKGIWEGSAALFSPDKKLVRNIFDKRKIDFVLICPKSGQDEMARILGHQTSLYARLKRKDVPYWLKKVTLPRNLSTRYMLFERKVFK